MLVEDDGTLIHASNGLPNKTVFVNINIEEDTRSLVVCFYSPIKA